MELGSILSDSSSTSRVEQAVQACSSKQSYQCHPERSAMKRSDRARVEGSRECSRLACRRKAFSPICLRLTVRFDRYREVYSIQKLTPSKDERLSKSVARIQVTQKSILAYFSGLSSNCRCILDF